MTSKNASTYAKSVTLENCDQEPIHLPGSIQPHGMLLSITEPDGIIVQVSANSQMHIDLVPQAILGQSLDSILGTGFVHKLIHSISKDCGITDLGDLSLRQGTYRVIVHPSEGVWIVELEPVVSSQTLTFPELNQVLVQLQSAQSIADFCQMAAEKVRQLTGFDRVMVYRFDPEYNGEVIAEAKREDLEPFLGLHYPHTDIPRQARELYMKNYIRQIVDVNYPPARVIPPQNPLTRRPLDMSFSVLRSVSPIHVEYLQNMGVGASMSISLLKEGILWGLFACHHYAPHLVGYPVRSACEFLGRTFSMMLAEKEKMEAAAYELQIKSRQNQLLQQISLPEQFPRGLYRGEVSVLDLFAAGGAAVCLDGECVLLGNTPTREQIAGLLGWLQRQVNQEVFHTSALATVYPPAGAFADCASGLVAVTISRVQREYLLWFRPEERQTVTWAGDPAKVATLQEDGVRLSPRKSFQAWAQRVGGKSLPWHPAEIRAVSELRSAITDIVLTTAGELKLRADLLSRLNRELEQSNNELDSFAYIASHDLKEPLRGIHNYASFLLEDYAEQVDEDGQRKLRTLVRLSRRMDELLDSLLHFSRVGRLELVLQPTDLNTTLMEVLESLHFRIEQTGTQIRLPRPLPVVPCDPVRMREVWMNLLSNAVKYNDKPQQWIEIGWMASAPPQVAIPAPDPAASSTLPRETPAGESIGMYTFYVKDNGIGIAGRHFESVFKIFKRLHAQDKYGGGTGAGLTIVKKIVERHGGKVWLESTPGEGTTFYFTLPGGQLPNK